MSGTPVQPAKLAHRLTTQDASFLYGESRNGPLHIGALGFFEGALSLEDITRHVEQRLHLIPRYRQCLAFVPLNLAHPTWEDDQHFSIDRHLKHHRLPEGSGEAALTQAAMRVYERPLALDRPVWEMHLFSGLEGGRSAVLWKMHHCLVDGVSGMELLNVILDFRADSPPPEQPETPWRPALWPNAARSVMWAAFDLVQVRLEMARLTSKVFLKEGALAKTSEALAGAVSRLATMAARPIVAAPWNAGLVTQKRSLAWLRCSFADMRAIRNAIAGTVNDVVLAILSEAAARYLKFHECPIDGRPLRIGCPVNVRRRNQSGASGNSVSMMFPELPAVPMDPVARLMVVAQETERRKLSGEPRMLKTLLTLSDLVPPVLMGLGSDLGTAAMDRAARMFEQLPPSVARLLAPRPAINFVATSVPGAQVPLFLGHHRMIDCVGLVPLGTNLGYGVTILSYNQNLYFGLIAEPRLMPDVDLMKFFVNQVFEELKSAVRRRAAAETPCAHAAAAAPAAREASEISVART